MTTRMDCEPILTDDYTDTTSYSSWERGVDVDTIVARKEITIGKCELREGELQALHFSWLEAQRGEGPQVTERRLTQASGWRHCCAIMHNSTCLRTCTIVRQQVGLSANPCRFINVRRVMHAFLGSQRTARAPMAGAPSSKALLPRCRLRPLRY